MLILLVLFPFCGSHHTNCLARVDDNHAQSELGIATQQWVGKLYTLDEQCVIAKGLGSHLCRVTLG